jgi:hypothetical protein
MLIPGAFFVVTYAAVSWGAYAIEKDWVARNGLAHWVFCTGVDIAISAGIGFQPQFERAQCQEASGSTPAPLTPSPDAKP